MAQPKVWNLRGAEPTSKLAEWAGEMDYESTVVCPINDGHQRAGKRLPNLSIKLPGSTIEDFVWTWHSECLLADRVLDLLKARNFTGFEVKPVKAAFKRSKEKPPRLWELVVTGWAGIAPPESGIKLVEDCPACGHKVYSAWTNPEKLIVPTQWDGSDFFMVWPLPNYIFVTDRVAKAIGDNGFTGGILKSPSDLVFSVNVIPILCPGRLSYSMPDDRARELGEPLGIY